MFNHTNRERFEGARVSISVGEPWDFDSPDGENRVNGKIVKISFHSTGPEVIEIKTTPFNWEGSIISQLFCSTRYGKEVAAREFSEARRVSCNMHFNKFGKVFDSSEMASIPFGQGEWAQALIGSISLID